MTARQLWFMVDHLPIILHSPRNEDENEVFDFAVLLEKLYIIVYVDPFMKMICVRYLNSSLNTTKNTSGFREGIRNLNSTICFIILNLLEALDH